MQHTKFRGNRPAGSGEDFLRVFTIYGCGGHLGHVTSIMSSDFHLLVPESFHTKFGSDLHTGVTTYVIAWISQTYVAPPSLNCIASFSSR